MKCNVVSLTNKAAGSIELDDLIFGLEVRKDVSDTGAFKEVSRTLIKFDLTYISESIVSRLIPDSGSKAARFFLNLYDAHPTSLAASQSLFAYPVSQSWVMGEGRSYDNPITKEGCSWNFSAGITDGTLWTPEVTASTSEFSVVREKGSGTNIQKPASEHTAELQKPTSQQPRSRRHGRSLEIQKREKPNTCEVSYYFIKKNKCL